MSRDISLLHPRVATLALRLVEECAYQGVPLVVTQTLRSYQEQDELYAQGRTKAGPPCVHDGHTRPIGSCPIHPLGCIVTQARGGWSYHNFGLAFDVAVKDKGTLNWHTGVDVNDNDITDYEEIGTIGQILGLEWGGAWKFSDFPHFQLTYGLTLKELRDGTRPPKTG
jgi:peptidoglycan LD-endopeptidase CwlK